MFIFPKLTIAAFVSDIHHASGTQRTCHSICPVNFYQMFRLNAWTFGEWGHAAVWPIFRLLFQILTALLLTSSPGPFVIFGTRLHCCLIHAAKTRKSSWGRWRGGGRKKFFDRVAGTTDRGGGAKKTGKRSFCTLFYQSSSDENSNFPPTRGCSPL